MSKESFIICSHSFLQESQMVYFPFLHKFIDIQKNSSTKYLIVSDVLNWKWKEGKIEELANHAVASKNQFEEGFTFMYSLSR